MKALLYKDWEVTKKMVLLLVLFFIGFSVYAIPKDEGLIALPMIFYLISFILTISSIGVDEQCNIALFIYTGTIDKKEYVWSKYVISLFLNLCGGLLLFFVIKSTGEVTAAISILIAMISMGVSLLIIECSLPIIFHFGVEKGRLIMFIGYFAIFTLFANSMKFLKEGIAVFEKFQRISPSIVAMILGIILLLLFFLSIKVATKIVERKEY